MTYLPNSIERCTPIVGFDPYAYIMDRPSNLQINKMQSPYQTDYYAVGPDKNKNNTAENPDGTKKKGFLGTAVKFAAGAAAIGLAVFGISKGAKALSRAGSTGAAGGFLSKLGTHLQNAGTCALRTIGNGINFAGKQLTRLANYITTKVTPPTPPTPPTP